MRALARLYGIQPSYTSATGHRVVASVGSLVRGLHAVGAPLSGPRDAAEALRARRAELEAYPIDPVLVAWNGRVPPVAVRTDSGRLRVGIAPEDLEPSGWLTFEPGQPDAGGRVAVWVPGGPLEPGYHTLHVDTGGARLKSLVMSAPRRAPALPGPRWGVFAPAYAIRSAGDWGVGTFGDLGRLGAFVRNRGGEVVATLPLLAAFLDQPFEPSPYSPASRLFWNELHVDVEAAPELARSDEARRLLDDDGFRGELRRLHELDLLDHRGVMAAKRSILEPLAETFFAGAPPREFDAFVAGDPRVRDYARFRAEHERRRTSWPDWPALERDGSLAGDPMDDPRGRYHLYVQWLAAMQLDEMRSGGRRLLLDLPLGVDGGSYDVWRERRLFASQASAGAPPDAFFPTGQDWGFPPLHPDRIREDGYAYPRACIGTLARYASAIRIDHVMGLHRLYWVPHGAAPGDGVYVRYHAEEWYAMLSIEAHRAAAIVVGEDLGTVPGYVRKAMRAHGVHTSYVVPFEVSTRAPPGLREPPAGSVASLGTHDMPPWAAFWSGSDVDLYRRLGIVDDAEAARRRRDRQAIRRTLLGALRRRGALQHGEDDPESALRACLRFLAQSQAAIVLSSLEDLWLEERPQNIPGTAGEVPNWRGRFRYTLEELVERDDVLAALGELADRSWGVA